MRIKYPKLSLLVLIWIATYFILTNTNFTFITNFVSEIGLLGAFIAGIGYSYGFTAAPATAIFLVLGKTQNLLLASFFGGLGSLIADLIIFHFVRQTLLDEINMFKEEKYFKKITELIKKLPNLIQKYFTITLACIIIGSPLPDEIGVTMLASEKEVSDKTLMTISLILNTIGIFLVLYLGSGI